MKKNIEHFMSMGSSELMETNGGGFAYDVGRILRFLSFGPGFSVIGTTNAIIDWEVTNVLNEYENDE